MVCETEKVSSLTFEGTQSSNMSDGGARNNNKVVFIVFVKLPTAYRDRQETLQCGGKMFFWFIVLVVVLSLKGCWWFGGLRMEARLHSQAHKAATRAT